MIRLERPAAVPQRLQRKGRSRKAQDCAAYGTCPEKYCSGEWTFQYDDSIYAAPGVKARLLEMHHCKCCYCERKLPPNKLHVEHFRPKGAVRQSADHDREWPGYYWLAYKWDNLLLACRRCNIDHKKELFPLGNPTKRARNHDCKVADEKQLFIDPASQNPRRHIKFVGDAPIGRSKRGRETIKGIGLDKSDLRERRSVRIAYIDAMLFDIDEAARNPGDEELATRADKARKLLELAVEPQTEFSSMAIDYVALRGI